jgi:hypothetical protein
VKVPSGDYRRELVGCINDFYEKETSKKCGLSTESVQKMRSEGSRRHLTAQETLVLPSHHFQPFDHQTRPPILTQQPSREKQQLVQ